MQNAVRIGPVILTSYIANRCFSEARKVKLRRFYRPGWHCPLSITTAFPINYLDSGDPPESW